MVRTRRNTQRSPSPDESAAAAARDADTDPEEGGEEEAILDEELQDNEVTNQVRGEEDDDREEHREEHRDVIGDVEEEEAPAANKKNRNRTSNNTEDDAADQEGDTATATASPAVEGKDASDPPSSDPETPASAVLAATQPVYSPNVNKNSSSNTSHVKHHYIYPRRKVPPPPALHNLNDLVDYYVERIFVCRSNRLQDSACLKYFWGLHPANECEFGYYHVRVRLANLLVDACGHPAGAATGTPPPLDEGSDDADDGTDEPNCVPFPPTVGNVDDWTRERWVDFLDDLKETVELVQRRDAAVLVVEACDDSDEDARPASRAQDRVPAELYGKVLRRIHLLAALAPVRKQIEAVIAGTRPEVDPQLLRDFAHHCEGSDPIVRRLRRRLLVPNGIGLQDVPAVVSLFEQPELGFQTFQESLDELVHQLYRRTYGSRVPELFALRYRLPPTAAASLDASNANESLSFDDGERAKTAARTSTTARNENDAENRRPRGSAVRALQRDREALRHTVRDPLPSARKRAAHATGAARIRDDRVGSGAEERSDGVEDEDRSTVELSELAPPRRRRSNMFRSDVVHPPEPGLFDDTDGRALKRRRWTDEEKAALKQGVETHGAGQWAQIKKDHPLVLRNRHNVQLKDCWRTMVKRGEVQDPFHPDAPEPSP